MDEDDTFDPETQEAREVAAEAGQEPMDFLSLIPHYYRGELGQMSTRISRLDLTVDWVIGVIAAVLALSFASPESPPYFLLIGMFALTMFLIFDIRRYRSFDATRSRVRMIEENVFANAFNPEGSVHREWRKELVILTAVAFRSIDYLRDGVLTVVTPINRRHREYSSTDIPAREAATGTGSS